MYRGKWGWGVDVALMNLLRDKMKFKINWDYYFSNITVPGMVEKVRKYEFEIHIYIYEGYLVCIKFRWLAGL